MKLKISKAQGIKLLMFMGFTNDETRLNIVTSKSLYILLGCGGCWDLYIKHKDGTCRTWSIENGRLDNIIGEGSEYFRTAVRA